MGRNQADWPVIYFVFLMGAWCAEPAFAQAPGPPSIANPSSTNPTSSANSEDPAILQIRIVEGDGFVYTVGSRATRGVVVHVADETGSPVEGATVSFRLPESGPTGTFAEGGRTEIAMTTADGRAEAWGMQWNSTPGQFDLRVTAAKGAARAGTLVPLYLMEELVSSSGREDSQSQRGGGSSKATKKLWISVAVIGAALAAVAGASAGRSIGGASAPVINAPQIGAPDIHIAPPGQ